MHFKRHKQFSKRTVFLTASLAFLLVACGGPDLACGTPDAKKLVDRLARESFKNPINPDPVEAKRGVFTLRDIVTTEKGKTKTSCKATLHVRVTPGSDGVDQLWERDFKIEYFIEKTDDDRLYVTLRDF